MRRLLMATTVLGMMATTRAEAGPIVGTQVTGFLGFGGSSVNNFDPANGLVPNNSGYENAAGTTVAISSSAVEFGYYDGGNRDTADFTEGRLVFTDFATGNFGNLPIHLAFTDPAFTGASLDSTSFVGLTYSFSGSTLSIDIPMFVTTTNASYTASFTINPSAAVPEPASALMLGLGVAGVGLAGWKRSRRPAA